MPKVVTYCDQANPPIVAYASGYCRPVPALPSCRPIQRRGARARTVQVRSYVRKDDTVVKAYTRAARGAGTAPRSTAARRAFQAQQPCPSTDGRTGPCPGYVVDHVRPLACGGIDAPENMQWQTIAEGKLKDRRELEGCDRPTILKASASAEPSTSSPTSESHWRGERRNQRTSSRGRRSGSRLTGAPRLFGTRLARPHYTRSR